LVFRLGEECFAELGVGGDLERRVAWQGAAGEVSEVQDERHQTGEWWKREELREYLPTLSLDQFR
jgi:hypothetical protein